MSNRATCFLLPPCVRVYPIIFCKYQFFAKLRNVDGNRGLEMDNAGSKGKCRVTF